MIDDNAELMLQQEVARIESTPYESSWDGPTEFEALGAVALLGIGAGAVALVAGLIAMLAEAALG